MDSPRNWSLLVLSLPTENATARMRFWRALKALGCAALRDGVYLLPKGTANDQALQELAEAVVETGGGMAQVMPTQSRDEAQDQEFRQLFDRSDDYGRLAQSLATARASLSDMAPQELTRLLRKLRREYDAIQATDHFPNDASRHAEASWKDFVHAAENTLSPGEPEPVEVPIPRLDAASYQGRTWATRRQMWVDRAASAWLIRRFIDPSNPQSSVLNQDASPISATNTATDSPLARTFQCAVKRRCLPAVRIPPGNFRSSR